MPWSYLCIVPTSSDTMAITNRPITEAPLLPDPVHSSLYVAQEHEPGPMLLLIHGLGANGGAWEPLMPLVRRDWRGAWVVPDLRGHGRSTHTGLYSFGAFAADLAPLVGGGNKVAIIGHSLGGLLGAFLASGWFGLQVDMVLALSVKTVWSDAELNKFRALSEKPVAWMDTRGEAEGRLIRASGLTGIADASSAVVKAGISELHGRFRFAADSKVIGSPGPNVGGIIRAARCPVHFATGEMDQMAPVEQHLPFDPRAVVIAGAGHNVHMEKPEEVWELFRARWQAHE